MQEEAYVEFLRIRRVPLQEKKCTDNVSDVVPQVSTIPTLETLYMLCSCFVFVLDMICCLQKEKD